jgi:hypothetical protein
VNDGASFSVTVTSPDGDASHQFVVNGPATQSIAAVHAAQTITFTWTEQWYITFSETGVDSDFTGTIVTVDGIGYGHGDLPKGLWLDAGEHAFEFGDPLVVTADANRYVWTSTSGGLSTLKSDLDFEVTTFGSITGNYKTQFLVSFAQTGSAVAPTVDYTAVTDPTGTVPFDVWVLAGSEISYTYQAIVPGASGVQYVLTLVSPASPQTITAPLTITGTYKTQFKVHFEWSGLAADANAKKVVTITVGGTPNVKNGANPFYDAWLDSGTTVSYAYEGPITITPNVKQYRLVSVTGNSAGQSHDFGSISGAITEAAVYKAQFKITLGQTGVGTDFTGTVVIIDAANYDWSGASFWWDENSFHGFAFQSPLVITGKTYFWVTTDGLSTSQADASFKVIGSGAITGNYNFFLTLASQPPVAGPPGANVTMYYLSVVSPYGNPTGSGWYAPGSVASFGVTTPVDQGNQTVRIFIKWSGDVDLSEPLGTIVMNKPSEVIASWQTQYLVLFDTTLPNGNRLVVPGVPQALPLGLDIFGAFYAAGSNAAGGPAPLITLGPEGARYVFEGWDLDGVLLTPGTDFSFLVNGPHNASMVFDTEFLLVVNATGVAAPFSATLTITASPPVPYQLTPTSAVEEWYRKNAGLSLLISTPNKIGQGVWAVFKQWSGSAQGTDKSVSLVMSGSKTVNAVFFSTNPVAESLPYSIVAGLVCFGLAYYMTRNKKGEQKGSTRMTFSTVVAAIALLVAAIMSAMIATGFGISVGELPDVTNWAVLFLGAEALILFYATYRFTKGGQPEHAQAVLGTAEVPANPYGV